jgi:hypothetical protein
MSSSPVPFLSSSFFFCQFIIIILDGLNFMLFTCEGMRMALWERIRVCFDVLQVLLCNKCWFLVDRFIIIWE